VASGLSLERAQEHPLPIGQGLVGLAAEQRQGILNGTLSDTDRSWDDRVKTRTLGSVIIPLVRGAEVVAVLDLRNKTGGRAFDGADLELANALAQQSVLFLDNARFHDAQGQYQAAVNDLVRDVTEKQLTWPGHIDNVHAICERLAHRVGLPDDKLAALRLAVAVHDIGLLDVDRVDAGPPGGPADHAARGGERLEAMASWAEAAPIVRAHHEMMDGSGPLGLRGFAIPMAARILALAEYVDSVTNPASPWGRKSVDDIIAELKDPDDRRFDPTVVKAFLTEQGSNLDDPELDEMEVVHPL
jgi:HD-GYP domain-containing protein (c-di-GMP phosphodiesterase class II)